MMYYWFCTKCQKRSSAGYNTGIARCKWAGCGNTNDMSKEQHCYWVFGKWFCYYKE